MGKTALDGRRLNAFAMDPDDLTIIGIDTDVTTHPLYDERVKLPLDDNMVKNIMAMGILETVIVWKDGDHVVVVDGRQRVRWARRANELLTKEGKEKILVPCMVRRGDDADLFGIMISANEIRQDDSMLVRAKKAQRLLDMGRSEADVALAFGVTPQAVKAWLKVLDLAPAVKKAVDEGKLSATAASKLAGLDREAQEKELGQLLADGKKPTGRRVAKVANGHPHGPGKKQIKKVADHIQMKDPKSSALLGWVLGELDDEEIRERIPAMKGLD